jgi:hypothetical protein
MDSGREIYPLNCSIFRGHDFAIHAEEKDADSEKIP